MTAAEATEPAHTSPLLLYFRAGMVGFGVLIYSMQYSMISVAIPDMITELDTSLGTIGWIVSIYVVTQAIAMPIAGKISDQLGRREVFIFGLLAYGLSSGACGLAPDSAILIVGRVVQGVSAGILIPSSFGLISDWFSDRTRLRAVGLLSSVPPMGSIIGPSVGAALVSVYNWRMTFLVNPVIVIPLIVFALFNIPAGKRQKTTSRIDYLGSVLLAIMIGALLLALDRLGRPAQTRSRSCSSRLRRAWPAHSGSSASKRARRRRSSISTC